MHYPHPRSPAAENVQSRLFRLEAAAMRADSREKNHIYGFMSARPPYFSPRDASKEIAALELAFERIGSVSRIQAESQRYLSQALEVLADTRLHNRENLLTATGELRRPRIYLDASLNRRSTLEVRWSPVWTGDGLDAEGGNRKRQADFRTTRSVTVELGVDPNVVFRILASVHRLEGHRVPARHADYFNWLENDVKNAVMQGLDSLIRALSMVCEVHILAWPVYRNGSWELQSVLDRMAQLAKAEKEEAHREFERISHVVHDKLGKAGLSSVDEFEALDARSKREGVKASRLVFEKTGKACSSLLTESLRERMPTYREAEIAADAAESAFERIKAEWRRTR